MALCALAGASLLLPQALPLPNFSASGASTPSVLIVSLIAAVVALQAGLEPIWDLYATSGPWPRVVNIVRILVVALVGSTISALSLGSAVMSYASTAVLLGLGLGAATTLGHGSAWVVPVAYVLVLVGAGAVTTAAVPAWWAVPVSANPGIAGCLTACVILFSGLLGWSRAAGRQSRLDDSD